MACGGKILLASVKKFLVYLKTNKKCNHVNILLSFRIVHLNKIKQK